MAKRKTSIRQTTIYKTYT